jgi:hypothetical protein
VLWIRLGVLWYEDEKLEAAAEAAGSAGPLVISAYPVLLAKSKVQKDGGKVEFTWRKLSQELFAERTEVKAAVDAMLSAGVLTCPQRSARGATVAFDELAWRKWQDSARKAAERQERKAA